MQEGANSVVEVPGRRKSRRKGTVVEVRLAYSKKEICKENVAARR